MKRILRTIVIGVMFATSLVATEPPVLIRVEAEPSENQLTPNQIEQIIRLRERLGSSLSGSFLEKEPLETEAEFRDALHRYSQQVQQGQTNPPEILTQSDPSLQWPTVPGADPLVRALRHTSLLLEQRSHQLQISQNAENNRGLRRLAKRLRKQIRVIETNPFFPSNDPR